VALNVTFIISILKNKRKQERKKRKTLLINNSISPHINTMAVSKEINLLQDFDRI
jgi:hypothetical protein